ncbi:MAG: UDP-glucose/GDP-mannose dehydrogenase family protein [Holosporales bacterium]|jgi:UDPglucose 6-dehydrogenase|nr:UDP-glucose/GDP-mannose dehydrogenase family protein [Holosporales bacterium]
MKVTMVGTGYVGLVTGTCLSSFGFEVICVDNNKAKIEGLEKGIIPIYEPGLDTLVDSNLKQGRLSFTTDLIGAVKQSEVVFLAVGTPSKQNSEEADLTFLFNAAEEVAKAINHYTVIVIKSTVPVGTCRRIKDFIKKTNPQADFDVTSNPEFLREGSAIEDFMRPDRVVVGAESERSRQVMDGLYKPLSLLETPVVFTTLETSELSKYASNAFLATKICFINQLADLSEKCGANVQHISKIMGLDHRIGKECLHVGPGYGGSCFPKDTMALSFFAKKFGTSVSIVDAVITANKDRKLQMAKKVISACGGSVKNKKIAILGVTFKPETDDIRDAPSLVIIPELQRAGASIHANDPASHEAEKVFSNVTWRPCPYEACAGADAVVIMIEWNQFRSLDFAKLKQIMKTPIMIDLKNIYSVHEVESAGFFYESIGRGKV